MVIPLPSISVHSQPSEWVLSLRKYFYFLIVFMFLCAVVRMYIWLDIIGGFMLCVIAGIGLYCLREGTVDVNCLVTWGMVCCINGVMDALIVIDRMVKLRDPVFKMENGAFLNILWGLYLSGPVAEIVAAVLVWILYREATQQDSGTDGAGGTYGTMPPQDFRISSPQQPTFKAFEGQGNKLGE